MQQRIKNGIYPTMVTPYTRDDQLDENALRLMVRWYERKGCHGIFAACQSSEIFSLSAKERKTMVQIVKDEIMQAAADSQKEPLTLIASGHISDDPDAQAEELTMMAEAGADAVVLISNRLDISNTGTLAWIQDLERLADALPASVPLGIYECPYPYKRLLNEEMLQALLDIGRFRFFKDTCCNPLLLQKRMELLKGSELRLYNANAQTFLTSLQYGCSGYCGIMANFHPELYVSLYEQYSSTLQTTPQLELLGSLLSLTAFTESLAYPLTAKYYLNHYEHIPMNLLSRSCTRTLGEYDRLVMEQLYQISRFCRQKANLPDQ